MRYYSLRQIQKQSTRKLTKCLLKLFYRHL